jgi:excisionase family DNA binding protein
MPNPLGSPRGIPPGAPEYLSVQFVAFKLSVHEDTVRKLIRARKLEAILVGRVYRIPRSELPRLREILSQR